MWMILSKCEEWLKRKQGGQKMTQTTDKNQERINDDEKRKRMKVKEGWMLL